MGDLSEVEIFSRMAESFGEAIQCCEDLAVLPLKGPTYDRFRRELRLIEGCCRQASAWREDTRWLPIGRMMAEVHQKAGGWLRGIRNEAGQRIPVAPGQQHQLFKMLATNLRALKVVAEKYRTEATGRVGMILPDVLPGPHRDTRPVGYTGTLGPSAVQRPSGLIIPASATMQ